MCICMKRINDSPQKNCISRMQIFPQDFLFPRKRVSVRRDEVGLRDEWFQDEDWCKTSYFPRNEWRLGGVRSVQEMNGSRMKVSAKPTNSTETINSSEEMNRFQR